MHLVWKVRGKYQVRTDYSGIILIWTLWIVSVSLRLHLEYSCPCWRMTQVLHYARNSLMLTCKSKEWLSLPLWNSQSMREDRSINNSRMWLITFVWSEVAQSCPTLCDPMDCSLPGSSCPWDFPGNSPGVDCHFLLQGIFPTQGSNLGLPHCKQTLFTVWATRELLCMCTYIKWFGRRNNMLWKWNDYRN